MLAGKRALRVGDQILKEISYLLIEKVKDPRVRGVTLTGIKLSKDLKMAGVFYSVIGQKYQIDKAQAGLESARSFIKREISLRMELRYTPEIIFSYDASLEIGSHMERLFDKLRSDESRKDIE